MRKRQSFVGALVAVTALVFGATPAVAEEYNSGGQSDGGFEVQAGREFYHPTSGTVTSRYESRCPGYDNHYGVDIANAQGTRIRAARGGDLVTKGYEAGGYGHYVILKHASNYKTLYAHLREPADLGGDRHANTNELIGYMGSTGSSTGPHLHFEVRRGDGWGTPLNINGSYNCGEHVQTFNHLRQHFPGLNPV